MIEADTRLRKRARQIGQLVDLSVEQPGVEAEIERREPRKARGRSSPAVPGNGGKDSSVWSASHVVM